jgi:hypothetical protein
VFQAFMSQALAGQPDIPLPDPGSVCARAGGSVNPLGGRDQGAPVFVPTPAQQPTVQQPTTPTPTAPAATTPAVTTPPVTRPHGNGNGQ